MPSSPTILLVPGSLRVASFNRRLAREVERVAGDLAGFDRLEGLDATPYFSQDLEGDATPAEVHALRDRIAAADAVLVVTPEYNGSLPGVLKNALDWASRPRGEAVLEGKPAAVTGASPGARGAVRAQADARKVLGASGARVLDVELPVPRAGEAFDADGRLTDAALAERLRAHVEALLAIAAGAEPAEAAELHAYSEECQRLSDAA